MGVENIVIKCFERNFLKTLEPQQDSALVVFLQKIGFSEYRATLLKDNFMSPQIIQYTSWNWVFAFLRLKLYHVKPLQDYPYCKETVGSWINIEGPDQPVRKGQFWNGNAFQIQIKNIELNSLNSTCQEEDKRMHREGKSKPFLMNID